MGYHGKLFLLFRVSFTERGYVRIAVVSSNLSATLNWLRVERKIATINHSRRYCVDEDGIEYHIISHREHAHGMKFDTYMVAPDYETLLDVVISRVAVKGHDYRT